jgi:predicted TIM-barrel fold metal-dependent hydrolase
MPGVPIIDCLFSLESVTRERRPEPRELAKEMDRAAIDRVLLNPCKRWRCEQHWGPDGISLVDVNAFVTAMPHRFGGLAAYDPYAIPESLALIELALENEYSGVYVQTDGADVGVADPRMYPLYGKCLSDNIPLIVQMGTAPAKIATTEEIAKVAKDFPDLKIIAGVCGTIDLPAMLSLCESYANIYFAFDGSLPFPNDIRRFRNSEIARHRAMFGSNGSHWVDLLDGVARLEMPYESVRAFMHDNAASVLRIGAAEGVGQ